MADTPVADNPEMDTPEIENQTSDDQEKEISKPESRKISDDDIFELLQYQGVITTEQAQDYFKKNKFHDNTIPNRLIKLYKANYLEKSRLKKPWVDSPIGKPNNLYHITKDGAKEVLRVSGRKLKGIETPKEKSMLHSLGLVEIALKCKELGYSCVVNRQVNILEESNEAPRTFLKPDVQIYSADPTEPIRFIEYEQDRMLGNLYEILKKRMERWQLLFESPGYEHYSKDILVLFWFGEKILIEQNKETKEITKIEPVITTEQKSEYALALDIWMQALFDYEKELAGGDKPSKRNYRIFYRRFIDFLIKPSVITDDYTLLVPSDNPQSTRLHLERDRILQKTANEILCPLDEEQSTGVLADCENQHKELWIKLLNASNRQEFFFSQAKKLYQLSNAYQLTGYAAAAIPQPSIYLVRHWIEQDQLSDLRDELITALITTHAAATKGQQTGAMMLEKMVWDVLFRYFNFASGGPITFRVTLTNTESVDRCYDLAPDTRIETPWVGVIETSAEAKETEQAINWLISTFLHYQKELGLTKDNRIIKIHNRKKTKEQ